MNGEPGLIGLLHRADWTRLALSAEASDGSAVLIAPGKRYRYQTADYLTGCDGGQAWEMPGEDEEEDGRVHWIGGPEPPLRRLLCPAWLLKDSRLRVRGGARVLGREAIDVVMTRRPGTVRASLPEDEEPPAVEVLVDAELGILLRVAGLGHDEGTGTLELVAADFDPVMDPAQFAPPPGSRIAESFGDMLGSGGPAWWAARTAAGLGAGALGAWIRYSRTRHPEPPPADTTDPEAAMPGGDPAPALSSEGEPPGQHLSDALLALLHAGGRGAFTATLHEWFDTAAMASQLPRGASRAGFGGLGLLMDAISERPATVHLVSTVRLGRPGEYQIDRTHQPPRGPKTIACDGHRRWLVYSDKVTTGPAEPPPCDIANLADPSWLLECRLAGGTQITVSNRPAYRINVARGNAGWFALKFPAAVAIMDAEMGILLRLTAYIGSTPIWRQELRDITASTGFQTGIPGDLPITEDTSPYGDFAHPTAPPHPVNVPLTIARLAARHAAAQAAKHGRSILRRMDPHQPPDDA